MFYWKSGLINYGPTFYYEISTCTSQRPFITFILRSVQSDLYLPRQPELAGEKVRSDPESVFRRYGPDHFSQEDVRVRDQSRSGRGSGRRQGIVKDPVAGITQGISRAY